MYCVSLKIHLSLKIEGITEIRSLSSEIHRSMLSISRLLFINIIRLSFKKIILMVLVMEFLFSNRELVKLANKLQNLLLVDIYQKNVFPKLD